MKVYEIAASEGVSGSWSAMLDGRNGDRKAKGRG